MHVCACVRACNSQFIFTTNYSYATGVMTVLNHILLQLLHNLYYIVPFYTAVTRMIINYWVKSHIPL